MKAIPGSHSRTGAQILIQQCWHCAVKLYQLWVDGKTFVELTRPWYGQAVGFPFSLYVPLRRQSTCRTRLTAVYGNSCLNDSELELLVCRVLIELRGLFTVYWLYLIRNKQLYVTGVNTLCTNRQLYFTGVNTLCTNKQLYFTGVNTLCTLYIAEKWMYGWCWMTVEMRSKYRCESYYSIMNIILCTYHTSVLLLWISWLYW